MEGRMPEAAGDKGKRDCAADAAAIVFEALRRFFGELAGKGQHQRNHGLTRYFEFLGKKHPRKFVITLVAKLIEPPTAEEIAAEQSKKLLNEFGRQAAAELRRRRRR